MYLKNTVFFFFVLLSSVVIGQEGMIAGTASDGSNSIPFANVVLKSTTFGTSANENGDFELENVPFGNYQLQISSIGFVPFTKKIELKSEKLQLGKLQMARTLQLLLLKAVSIS